MADQRRIVLKVYTVETRKFLGYIMSSGKYPEVGDVLKIDGRTRMTIVHLVDDDGFKEVTVSPTFLAEAEDKMDHDTIEGLMGLMSER